MTLVCNFDGTDDNRKFSIGGSDLTAALAMAAVIKRGNTGVAQTIIVNGSGGTDRCALEFNASNQLNFWNGTVGRTSTTTITDTTDQWGVGISRASGTPTPRF